jgi:hypothetical protein
MKPSQKASKTARQAKRSSLRAQAFVKKYWAERARREGDRVLSAAAAA